MANIETIHDRIQLLVDKYGAGKNTNFARMIGVSESNIRSYIGGVNPKADVLAKIVKSCDINPMWLITGEGNIENVSVINNPIVPESVKSDPIIGFNYAPPTAPTDEADLPPISHKKTQDRPFEHLMNPEKEPKRLPLVSVKAVGGFAGKDFSINEQDIESYYVIPKFRNLDVDFLIEVIGDSMMPRLFPGDIIACSVIRNPNFIQWNKTYLIATDEQGMIVKRLKKSSEKGSLLAVSDNVDYDPFDIPMADIKGRARVVCVIHAE